MARDSETAIMFRVGEYHESLIDSVSSSWGITIHETSKRLTLLALAGFGVSEYHALNELAQVIALKPIANGYQPWAAAVRAAQKHIGTKQAGKRDGDLSALIHELTEKTGMAAQPA